MFSLFLKQTVSQTPINKLIVNWFYPPSLNQHYNRLVNHQIQTLSPLDYRYPIVLFTLNNPNTSSVVFLFVVNQHHQCHHIHQICLVVPQSFTIEIFNCFITYRSFVVGYLRSIVYSKILFEPTMYNHLVDALACTTNNDAWTKRNAFTF